MCANDFSPRIWKLPYGQDRSRVQREKIKVEKGKNSFRVKSKVLFVSKLKAIKIIIRFSFLFNLHIQAHNLRHLFRV